MPPRKETEFVNTLEGVASIADWVDRQDTWMKDIQPPMYIDLEGERLGRNGTVSLMTVLVYPGESLEHIFVIDIYTLGSAAFDAIGERGKSLKNILEEPEISKVFFDVRNDSEALFALYGVRLRGVRDLQLMDSAARPNTQARRLLSGLAKCMEFVPLTAAQKAEWTLCKDKGERLWNPDKGGSYSVFNTRPLSAEVLRYCAGDVAYLPAMYKKYASKTNRWRDFVLEASQKRVAASQGGENQPQGMERALSPWTAEENAMLDSWSEVNPPRDYFSRSLENDFDDFDDFDVDDHDNGYESLGDDNDYEDWTRADWQGPPS
ncbi:ribonuclease H-like domain-containing protein [Trichoderma barbatum]